MKRVIFYLLLVFLLPVSAWPVGGLGIVTVHAAQVAGSWNPVDVPDLDHYEIWHNGEMVLEVSAGVNSCILNVAEGDHTFIVNAVDAGGKISETCAVFQIAVDETPPCPQNVDFRLLE